MSLAVNALGEVAEQNVSANISEIEPFRRLTADEAYVFTAGAHITYNAGGLILPMYSRAYFFPSADGKTWTSSCFSLLTKVKAPWSTPSTTWPKKRPKKNSSAQGDTETWE